jgi:hypothetical protein
MKERVLIFIASNSKTKLSSKVCKREFARGFTRTAGTRQPESRELIIFTG